MPTAAAGSLLPAKLPAAPLPTKLTATACGPLPAKLPATATATATRSSRQRRRGAHGASGAAAKHRARWARLATALAPECGLLSTLLPRALLI